MPKELYSKQHKKTNNRCRQCGWDISYSHTFEDMLSGRFKNQKDGSFTATRTTPVRAPGMTPDVLVPVAQSFVWAIVVGLPSISVAMWLRWEWSAPLFVGACTILVSWISAMRKSEFSLSKTEEFSYTANEFGDVEMIADDHPRPLRMEVIHEVSNIRSKMQLLDLPMSIGEREFKEFLIDILAGKSLARRNWAGSDKPFSRDGYDGMIEKMIGGSILVQSNNGKKVLSNGGRHAISAMIREGVI